MLREPNIRRKMRLLNSLIVLKNVKGGILWDFSTSILLQNIEKVEQGILCRYLKNFEKKSHKTETKQKTVPGGFCCHKKSLVVLNVVLNHLLNKDFSRT